MLTAPMRVTRHVHSLWPEFEIELNNGAKIPRFVTSYIIEGECLAVIDTAVESSVPEIFAYIESIGRSPEEVEIIINTHCHFDHIGGNGVFLHKVKPQFCAHSLDRPFIEDIKLQMQTRLVGRMDQIVSGPIKVDKLLNEGDVVDLGGGVRIEALHTPGHSAGSLSLFVAGDGVLICGDVLPEAGTLPIYEDVRQTLESLNKLRAVKHAGVLLSAMSQNVSHGPDVAAHIDSGEAYIRKIDRLVRRAASKLGDSPPLEQIGHRVFAELDLPPAGLIPIVLRSFSAHLESEPLA